MANSLGVYLKTKFEIKDIENILNNLDDVSKIEKYPDNESNWYGIYFKEQSKYGKIKNISIFCDKDKINPEDTANLSIFISQSRVFSPDTLPFVDFATKVCNLLKSDEFFGGFDDVGLDYPSI